MHGSLLCLLSGYHFYFTPGSCGSPNTKMENNILIMAVGYFCYDFVLMAYLGLLDFPMTFHHFICIVGMFSSVSGGKSSSLLVSASFIAEISNPPMHLRQILRMIGLRYTKIYEACEISFISLYIFGRFLMGFGLCWKTI